MKNQVKEKLTNLKRELRTSELEFRLQTVSVGWALGNVGLLETGVLGHWGAADAVSDCPVTGVTVSVWGCGLQWAVPQWGSGVVVVWWTWWWLSRQ